MKSVYFKKYFLFSLNLKRFRLSLPLFAFLFSISLSSNVFAAYTWEEVPTGYGLAWSDEFNGSIGTSPSGANWTYDTGTGQPNNELENYTTSTNNSQIISDPNAVDGKALAIIALDPGGNNDVMGNYTSARLKSQNLQTFTYGYMEARIRMPYGQGIWPAFWMLGNDISSVGWPACDEIDIMENIGQGGDQANNHGSLHDGNDTTQIFTLPGGQLFHNEYHMFSALWQANEIQFFCDGNLYETDTPATMGNNWAFNNNPNFILLNCAVGGSWPGNPDGSTSFPQTMYVDYVRVYQSGRTAPAPVTQSTWRVHCGGDTYTDGQSNVWAADTNFTGGWPSYSAAGISGTIQPTAGDQSLYQWQRYGNTTGGETVTYTFNVPNGNYQVDLKFAETYWTGAGQRQFNYSINGATEATNFDIFATAGGQNKAVDEVYNNITPNGNGQIVIQLTQGAFDNPTIGGIQIISNGPTATPTKTFTITPTFTAAPPTATFTSTPACGTLVANFESGTTTDNLGGFITVSSGGTGCTTTVNPGTFLPTSGDGLSGTTYGENFNGVIGTQGTCYGPSLLVGLGTGTPSYNAQAAGQNAEVFHIKILTGPASGPATVLVGVIPTNGTSSGFQYPLVIPSASFNTDLTETVYFSQMAYSYGTVTTLDTTQLYQLYYEPGWTGNYSLTLDEISFTCAPALTATPTVTKTFTSTYTLTATNSPTLTFTSTPSKTPTYTFTTTPTNSPTSTPTTANTATATNTNTIANTSTDTTTPSATATKSFTATPVNTSTATLTDTATKTSTPSFTFTASYTGTPTLSPTPVFTNTMTNTPVGTWTPLPTSTFTNTGTPSATSTDSFTPTMTDSSTSTSTFTHTATNSPTSTPTLTHTAAPPTSTYTNTSSPTATMTNTPSSTRTASATSTNSYTTTATATPTLTYTFTYTKTATPTPSSTATATLTSTSTWTNTPKIPTATYTFTVTPTYTPTTGSACSGVPVWNGNFVAYSAGQKVSYNGELYQCIQSHTSESNWMPPVVPALWKDLGPCGVTPTVALTTQSPVVYPNPVTSSTANLQLPVSNATNVKIQIFTLAFREVQMLEAAQVVGDTVIVSMTDKGGRSLANGLYYFVIQAGGHKWTNKVLVLR